MNITRVDDENLAERKRRLVGLGNDFVELLHSDVVVFMAATLYVSGECTLEECLASMLVCTARERDRLRSDHCLFRPEVFLPEYVI